MESLPDLLVAFAHQLGILAIVVVGLAASQREAEASTGLGQQIVAGLVFGIAAVLAMLDPIHVQPGVFVDTRSVVIAVAGLFGGALAALVATVLACTFRGWLGGAGMPVALAGLAGVALVGVAFGELVRRRRIGLSVPLLLVLSLAVTAVNLVSLMLLPAGVADQALRTVGFPLTVSNLLGIPFLGTILLAKMRQRMLRQELARALASQVVQAEKLRVSEAQYRIIATNTADVITRLDPAMRRIYISPSVRDILGYAPDELLGRSPDEIAHPDDTMVLLQNLTALSNGSMERYGGIHRVRHKDGRWIWMEVNNSAVLSGDPRKREILGVMRDISGRMELEEQVRQAQKMQVLGQLTGGVAHDFNNIMTVVLGNSELLAAELAEPEHRELALDIQAAAQRAADLTSKLLAFGRRQPLRPEIADLTLVAKETTGMLPRLLDPSVDIRTDFGGPCFALFDVTLMQSAILNLTINARDAVPNGGCLSIRTGHRVAGPMDKDIPEGSPVVFVTIEDDGAGMSAEVLERVFEPFFTMKKVGTGAGLGLSMVYGFVKQSGGHVVIESQVGVGTTASIVLRAAEGRGARDTVAAVARASLAPQSGPLS
jgi:PAS domain S-box-containing protein